ncbi:hypothetical protein V6Z11_A11G232800 [Gossypium hirsutum]
MSFCFCLLNICIILQHVSIEKLWDYLLRRTYLQIFLWLSLGNEPQKKTWKESLNAFSSSSSPSFSSSSSLLSSKNNSFLFAKILILLTEPQFTIDSVSSFTMAFLHQELLYELLYKLLLLGKLINFHGHSMFY